MRHFTLRTKLIAGFALLVLLPLLIGGAVASRYLEGDLNRQVSVMTAERLHQVNMNIEREIRSLAQITNFILIDRDITRILDGTATLESEMLQAVKVMDQKFLQISTMAVNEPLYITLLDFNGHMYSNWSQSRDARDRLTGTQWYRQTLDKNGYPLWSLNQDNYMAEGGESLITQSMVIKDPYFMRGIGVLVVSQPVGPYLRILQTQDPSLSSVGFIADGDGRLLADDMERANRLYPELRPMLQRAAGSGDADLDGRLASVSHYGVALTDWKVVQAFYYDDLLAKTKSIIAWMTLVFVGCLLLFFLLVLFYSTVSTRHLNRLRSTIKRIEGGHADERYEVRTRDEIGLLGRSFNLMLDRLRSASEREVLLERRKEQAKLEALQAQINPHFLQNTLNTLKWMSIMAKTAPITEMLMALGHLLDVSIHRGQEQITVAEELDNVRRFLVIQKYRFGDTIVFEEEIDPRTLDKLVPKLSLQPLVENVYSHGVFDEAGGHVRIAASADGELLRLSVTDNGRDVQEERLREVRRNLERQDAAGSYTRIGLKNVHQRIRMMYGPQYGLAIRRDPGSRTTIVSLELPLMGDETT